MNTVTNILGGLLLVAGVLSFIGAINNMRMVQQDPAPSDEDRSATGKLFLAGIGLALIGVLLIGAL